MRSKEHLVRVVKRPDGILCVDVSGKMNGRGAYICKDSQCLQKAYRIKGLQRSLKCAVPQEVLDQLEQEMMQIVTG